MELYHVLNRGVEKRNLFMNEADRARFVHDLFEFNDAKPAGSVYYSFQQGKHILDFVNPDIERIVDLHGWCLMGNHYHLLLSERMEGGLTLFLRKLNVGYANYFNEKYKRSGSLFQGRTKKVRIDSNAYFLHILNYIHLNPLDFLKSSASWRTLEITNSRQALAYLERYRWSSYLDYCGTKNFPSILTMGLFADIFKDYKIEIRKYLQDLDIGSIKPWLLE